MILRWLETLSKHDFEVVFRPGSQHGNADSLSRIDHAETITKEETEDQPEHPNIQAIEGGTSNRLVDILAEQKKDESLIIIRQYLQAGKLPDKLELRRQDTSVDPGRPPYVIPRGSAGLEKKTPASASIQGYFPS